MKNKPEIEELLERIHDETDFIQNGETVDEQMRNVSCELVKEMSKKALLLLNDPR
jgi:hypothetical protein